MVIELKVNGNLVYASVDEQSADSAVYRRALVAIAADMEAAEAMKPAIMTTYRRLEKYVNLTGSKSRVFSLIAVSLVHAYKKGRAGEQAAGDEQPPESEKAARARRRETGGHWG